MTDKAIKKILIIKLRGIGDVVLSTVVLDDLLNFFPEAQIDYLTDKSSANWLKGLTQVNTVLVYPKSGMLNKLKLITEIRKKKYDIVFDFYSNPSTAQITFLSGAEYRIGFPYRGRKYAYNLYGPNERGKYHAAELHLEVLKSVGIPVKNNSKLYFYYSKDDENYAEEFLLRSNLNDKVIAGISPTGGWQSKRCPPEKLAELVRTLNKKYNIPLLILWGPSDYEDAIKIKEIVGDSAHLSPPTTVEQMAALMSKCAFIVANDSGPMHISTAIGTPVLSLHGPTNPLHQGPFGSKHEYIVLNELECIMCNLLVCPKNQECFRDISEKLFLTKVEILLNKNSIRI
ncbi:glycosyltransferase family 9 protein [Melioribacter sp. OK-6-Me]|uniref:glycosyltransferase family 9 protein n=1 Tax=unclassified Melioribacter TaxID=2627329 RepID=UPI003EDA3170